MTFVKKNKTQIFWCGYYEHEHIYIAKYVKIIITLHIRQPDAKENHLGCFGATLVQDEE